MENFGNDDIGIKHEHSHSDYDEFGNEDDDNVSNHFYAITTEQQAPAPVITALKLQNRQTAKDLGKLKYLLNQWDLDELYEYFIGNFVLSFSCLHVVHILLNFSRTTLHRRFEASSS